MGLIPLSERDEINLQREQKRLCTNAFVKKADVQLAFSDYLIHYINQYKNSLFPEELTDDRLRAMAYEDLFELAIVVVNKTVSCVGPMRNKDSHGGGMSWDFSDLSDAKTCVVRPHGKSIDAKVAGIVGKGLLRVLVYCKETGQFFPFVFPRHSYEHLSMTKSNGIEIAFTANYEPKLINWTWKYKVSTFEEMCNANVNLYEDGANSVFRKTAS